jgi:hypothetical protein
MPMNFLEVFFNLAPSIGVGFAVGDNVPSGSKFRFPTSALGVDFGLRLWV